MAGTGAPIGNDYAAKGARWRNAIDSALELKCKSDGQKALVDIALAMIEKCGEGDMTAIKELGDRIDGKVAQSVNLGGQKDNPLTTKIVNEIVSPERKDG